MMPAKTILNWLESLPKDSWVAIDDGGLCLIDVDGDSCLEVGGTPETCGHSDCDSTVNVQSTYCGSLCELHLSEHCDECEVCRKDFRP